MRTIVTSAHLPAGVDRDAGTDWRPIRTTASSPARARFASRRNWCAIPRWPSSGLLAPTIGGPSVKPYQPDRYWENLNFPPRDYVPDTGDSQYRRGLYVWWQRTFLHPSLLAFDAPSREECTAERSRSNIPQQALVLLNDPTYVEAARGLARACSTNVKALLKTEWCASGNWRSSALRARKKSRRCLSCCTVHRERISCRSPSRRSMAEGGVGTHPCRHG